MRLEDSHLLGNVSVRKAPIVESQPSAMSSHRVWSPAQTPALAKAAANFPMTLLSHAARPEGSFVAATLAWHLSRPASFLPTAFSFAPVHLSARAGTAAMAKRTSAAKTKPVTVLRDGMRSPLSDVH